MSENHSPGLPVYFAIFFSLLILTGLTVWVAYHDWGVLNNLVAISIASTKAVLVILFFMHVRYEAPLIGGLILVSIVWLALLVGVVLVDVAAMGWTLS